MDPKANLQEQLELAREIADLRDGVTDDMTQKEVLAIEACIGSKGETLAELVLALDEWRRKGGFDPYEARLEPAEVRRRQDGHLALARPTVTRARAVEHINTLHPLSPLPVCTRCGKTIRGEYLSEADGPRHVNACP
jgi:hypothetical protein